MCINDHHIYLGRGQPAVIERKRCFKDVLYTGVCADGKVLTPILFTSDKRDAGQNSSQMPVVYLPKVKGPGTKSTQLWWDTLMDTDLSDRPLLLWDNLSAHHSKSLLEEMSDKDVTVLHFPTNTGALLNPCDNAFHADLKHRYFLKDRSDHGKMIVAIREAYFDTTEESIQNYWRHIGYTSSEPAEVLARQLNSEGWVASGERESHFNSMRDCYRHWKLNVGFSRLGLATPGVPLSLPGEDLDGVYWTEWTDPVVRSFV
jgi:hypothetical protein